MRAPVRSVYEDSGLSAQTEDLSNMRVPVLKTLLCIVFIQLYTVLLLTDVISTRVSDKLAQDLKEIEEEEQSDRATTIRKLLIRAIKEWKMEHALKLYHEGKVTLWRAARLAEVSLREMMEKAAQKGIEFKYTGKDLEEDIQAALRE